MSFFDTFTSLFAPDQCLSCRREGSLLCGRCVSGLTLPPNLCFSCRQPTPSVSCGACLQQYRFASLQATAHYQGLAKHLVANLKFTGNQSAARLMAQCIAATASRPPRGALVTHMPATTKHIRERGYDQAALIAKRLASLWDVRHVGLLARHGTRHQLGAGRDERLRQLQTALRIKNAVNIRDRTVILVDDVVTTGASVTAATEVLLAAGAARVEVVVFAQAIQK